MGRTCGTQSMVEPLRRVLVKRPDEAFAVDDPIKWHYAARPNLEVAQREHDALVAILRQAGAEVIYHDQLQPGRADAIFVHDPAIVTDQGAVILSMGKELRQGEEAAMAHCLEEIGVPVHYCLHGEARAEGGDLLWIDHDTLAVGQGFRTNAEGLRQLKDALEAFGVTIMPVQLPYYRGPQACLPLMSLISLVDYRAAVVYPSLLPVPFWQYLNNRGFQLIDVPDEEFETMGPNVLALAPGKCLMLEGNPVTKRRLEEAGCQVLTYRGNELSLKTEGGPTCLTRPILRSAQGARGDARNRRANPRGHRHKGDAGVFAPVDRGAQRGRRRDRGSGARSSTDATLWSGGRRLGTRLRSVEAASRFQHGGGT